MGYITSVKASSPCRLEKITVTNSYTQVEFISNVTSVTSEPPEQTSSEIQSSLCDCVSNIVKWHQKSTKEKPSKTLNTLLCSRKGLVPCLELVFLFGMRPNTFQEQYETFLWSLISKFHYTLFQKKVIYCNHFQLSTKIQLTHS